MSQLDKKTKEKVKETFKKTRSIRGTAKQVRVSRNTVKRIVKEKDTPIIREQRKSSKESKLSPFKAKIDYLVRNQNLSAVRVLEEIKTLGYDGGYSILKDYIRTIRPDKKRGPTTPIDHQPGQEAQMDWSPHQVILGGRKQIVHTGSIVLCFSRWLFIRFSHDEKIDKVIELHKAAFKELGAVPHTITYDNMTTVGRHKGPGVVWINPEFEAFSEEYGFEIIILPPGDKDRHGAVERPFAYIENNFLAGRQFADLEDLNQQSDDWRHEKANIRTHGTLRERPMDRLQRELQFLKPLPFINKNKYYRKIQRTIQRDFCVVLDTNRYSVAPELVGSKADIHLYEDYIEIWVNNKMHCRHVYCEDRHKRQVLPEHENAFRKMTGQSKLLETAFIRLGEEAKSYYEGLKRDKGRSAGYHLQRILKLADRYGSDVVRGAISYAQRYGAFSSDSVLRIITGKALKAKGHKEPPVDVPENIRQWLRACAVEQQDLNAYDFIVSNTNDTKGDSQAEH